MKKILIRFIPIFIFLIGFIIYDSINKKKRNANDNEYFNSLNLHLSGKIIEIIQLEFGHDYGIIKLNLKNSNRDFYDERNERDRHIGIIEKQKAKLIVMNVSEIKMNDSIFIEGRDFRIKRNNVLINRKYALSLPTIDFMNNPYSEINAKIILKK